MDFLKKLDFMQVITGLVILLIFRTITSSFLQSEIPEGNREIVIHTLGILEGAVIAIVSFYFGSSKGSQAKNDLINKQ